MRLIAPDALHILSQWLIQSHSEHDPRVLLAKG